MDPAPTKVVINVFMNYLSFLLTYTELPEFWRMHTFNVQWNMMRSIMLRQLTRWCPEYIHILFE